MKTLFITTASWEPRFILGSTRVQQSNQVTTAICYSLVGPNNRNNDSISEFKELFSNSNVLTPEVYFPEEARNSDDQATRTIWRKIYDLIANEAEQHDCFIFDITTTPREILWITLDLLNEFGLSGKVIYHRAESHSSWCGSNPRTPHIVPKLGGVTSLDSPTKLVILTGFDTDRCEHFISFFEPEETLIILQRGSSEEDQEKNQIPHKTRFSSHNNIKWKTLNSYGEDWGFDELADSLNDFSQGANLVMASIGPKTSSVALYLIHRRIHNSMLVYSSCRNYNEDYSSGIGETLELDWEPSTILDIQENENL